ncbi:MULTISPECIES: helix-turn-helix transcriptional regulator [unclassified Mycolicibacterium]|uniref:helix-turn-helix transcriptional regulator n=1 Tax=unclassified Mycolicibacterium TaxID=2636767 RepID=UPI002ED95945
MTSVGGGQPLRGRAAECETLRGVVADARSGISRTLVLRGEAGVGKTALLDYAIRQASSFRVTQVSGVESEIELAFAGLQQLCAPLLGHIDELPEPQRNALSVAFGLGVGPTPDRFLVGLAVLSLMAAASDDRPLLCVVDDAQWLDQVSVQTLGFVARRMLAEPAAMIFGVRDGVEDFLTGLPELRVTGLPDSDARVLLESVVFGGIDPRVRDRIVAETRGNPLALLEVPRTISAAEMAGGFRPAAVRLPADRVENGFVERIKALPPDTRRLVLAAAAEPVGDAALFLRAAENLGISADALMPAEEAGIVEFGPRIRFHHPLVRSAVYRAADIGERRDVHRALAQATDSAVDPDRRAWHAANATAGPDDAVAKELEASAWRAQTRGGIAAAATFLERAAILTAEPALRGSRAIAAAQAKRDAAELETAYELLALAELSPLTALQQAEVGRLRAQMEFTRSRSGAGDAPQLDQAAAALLDAATRLESLHGELAREAYVEAFAAAMYASRNRPEALTQVATAARVAVDRVPDLRHPIDLLLSGIAHRVTGGLADGARQLRAALETWCSPTGPGDVQALRWMALAYPVVHESAAGELWDDDLLDRMSGAMVQRARAAGALALLPPAIAFRAGVHVLEGEFAAATALMEEADAISLAIGHQPMRYHKVELAAWQGDLAVASSLIEAGTAEAAAKGEGRLAGVIGYTAAVLYNGLGRYEEALAAATEACEFDDLGFYGWCLLELAEAAAHTGDRAALAMAVRRLEDGAGVSGTDWGLGVLASARAMLAEDAEADALYTEALERLARTRVRSQLARAHLRYGEWLRRKKRRGSAREHLGTAHEMFTGFGARAFAERARRELIGTGEKVRKQAISSGDEMTSQEAQIARLARDGLTNQEIGAQLFISTHTVEWHLRKVFVKLGISSRRQLRTVSWPH